MQWGNCSRRVLLGGLSSAALGGGCRKRSGELVVGFSQMDNAGAWRIAETTSMREEIARRAPRYELVVTDAQDQTAKQVSDVEDLVARRVCAIFIAPRDYDGLEPVFEAARRVRVPVFLIDREAAGVAGLDYVSFLGSNFVEQGRRAAAWLVARTGGKAGVVELTGTAGSSVAADRAKGFREGLEGHAGVRIVASQTGQFTRAPAQSVTENVLQALGSEVTAVFAHNDEMALGAVRAIRAAGRRPGVDVQLVSIDGERAALESIVRGELGASVESNPRFGPRAFAALEAYLAGRPVPTRIMLEDRLFDATNAARFVGEAY